jgi:hypothetical protein
MVRSDQSKKTPKTPQIEKFRDKALELGCDDDEDKFKATLRTVVRHKVKPSNGEEGASS